MHPSATVVSLDEHIIHPLHDWKGSEAHQMKSCTARSGANPNRPSGLLVNPAHCSRTLTLRFSTRAISNISAPKVVCFLILRKCHSLLHHRNKSLSRKLSPPHCQPSPTSIHPHPLSAFLPIPRPLPLLTFSLSCPSSLPRPELAPALSPPHHRGSSQQSCNFTAFTF